MQMLFLKVRNKVKDMPGPEKWMIGTSFVAFIIAVVVSILRFIGGLEHL
jgi:hypothetical protein